MSFLTAHAHAGHAALGSTGTGLPRPDAILLNGGVFNSPQLTRALVKSVSALWPGAKPIPLLSHDSLDLAVARGAAYSGLARRALGKKIGGGAPRAFFAVVSSGTDTRGVCLIPRGLEEGSTVTLEREFVLQLGRPVQFQLVSTTADRLEKPGEVADVSGDDFTALPAIHTILEGKKGDTLRAHLSATLLKWAPCRSRR